MAEEPKRKKSLAVHVAEVVRHKGPIVLPDDMSLETALEVLKRRSRYEQEKVQIHAVIPVFVWDGALALEKALIELFGEAQQTASPNWWGGMDPPNRLEIESGPGETIAVPWGRFTLPGVDGYVVTGVHRTEEGRFLFSAGSEVTHKDEDKIRRLFERAREIALRDSIYRGKAFSIRFTDADDDPLKLPQPKFLALKEMEVVFTREIETAIEVNLLTPIRHTKAVRAEGIPLKRGALLAGVYGTGKTLSANKIALEAVANGWTFIYVTKVEELSQVLTFAQDFQPAVVFAEDVDRTAGIERDDEVNELLNTLDGIGSKAGEVMTILTSNEPESINKAMRRPGRIDLVLEVKPPDAEAVTRLIRLYGGEAIRQSEDLLEPSRMLAGRIPAVIREAVERSKLAAICRAGTAEEITSEDLVESARVLLAEQELFIPKTSRGETLEAHLGRVMAAEVADVVCDRVAQRLGV